MFNRFDVSMRIPGMPFDGETIETSGLGGSESAAVYLAKAMARLGARVIVFNETATHSVDRDGVQYAPSALWQSFVTETPHDVCVVQRLTQPFARPTNARLNFVWCHDLAFGRDRDAFRGALWNVDRIAVVSQWMADHYKRVHELDDDVLFVTRNGVDLDAFKSLSSRGIARDRKKLLYAARPERGLDLLLRDIMPRLLQLDSDLRVYVAGYTYQQTELLPIYNECRVLAQRLGDRVIELGSLSKRELYAHYLSAGLYVYPTPSPQANLFREVSCIAALESQAAGLPIVTTRIGALPETIAPGAGVLLDADPSQPNRRREYVQQFVDSVMTLVNDDHAWNAASACGLGRARDCDWSGIAREWLAEFERLLRKKTSSTERMVRHFCRNSDALAARHALGDATEPELSALLEPWSFVDEPEGTLKRWSQIGATRPERGAADRERGELVGEWLREHVGAGRRVLDYGCGDGSATLALVEMFPQVSFAGLDIDRKSIDLAVTRAADLGVSSRASFSVCNETLESERATNPGAEPFDCALVELVLDCVREPWALLENIERRVRPGGKIHLAVRFGPWEASDRSRASLRGQLWQLDAHDLRDMLDHKPDLQLDPQYYGQSAVTGDALGWWSVSYTADHRPVPPIDVERHVWLQQPRQSVTASIIAGPGSEETLHWMLRSIRDVADEILIADCGMNEEARRIAHQYGVRLIEGVDPLTEGFDTARNHALDACRSDWCLCMDTDERLVNAGALPKYLRENAYHTYAIKQHQLACDVDPSFNLAARLFRRRQYRGQTLRYWGAIHEVPELALNEGAGPATYLSDVHIAHLGYLHEDSRRNHSARNLPLLDLDQERYPERTIQKYYMIRENMHLVRHALEQGDGELDDAIRKKCRETIDLYRAHLLRDDRDTDCSALEYYSEALRVLNAGFDSVVLIGVGEGAEQARPRRFRFASSADLEAVLRREAHQKARQYDSPWW